VLKYFRPNNCPNSIYCYAVCAKKIITFVFKTNINFFAGKCQKSPKVVVHHHKLTCLTWYLFHSVYTSMTDVLRTTVADSTPWTSILVWPKIGQRAVWPGANFSYIFSGENFGENSAENFTPKMLGKNWIFFGKIFEKSFFQEIPRNFLRKVIFPRKKMYEKLAPEASEGHF
jgi:hypothetical protein